MNGEFQSIGELYQRVLPALRTKVHMLKKEGIYFVVEEDIWNILMDKWKRGRGLTLFDIVDDILKLDKEIILEKVHKDDNRE